MILPLVVAMLGLSLGACGGGGSGGEAASPGSGAEDASVGTLTVQELVPLLTRAGVGSDGVGLDLTYAPPQFFDMTGLKRPPEMDARPTIAFMLQETVHEGELPSQPPETFIEFGRGDRIAPYSAEVTAEDPHHRTVRLLFPQPDGWSERGLGDRSTITLVVPWSDGTVSRANTFVWELPIDLGDGGSAEG